MPKRNLPIEQPDDAIAPVKHPLHAPGLKVKSGTYWDGWEYIGDGSALVGAGLVREEWLPGEPLCPAKTVVTTHVHTRKYVIERRLNGRFKVRVWYGDKDKELAAEMSAQDTSQQDHDDPPYMPIIDADSDWPPCLQHHPRIKIGDGSKWHYLGDPELLILEGLLDPEETPGHSQCKQKGYAYGCTDGIMFMATKLGKQVAVTILGKGVSMLRCVPHVFNVR